MRRALLAVTLGGLLLSGAACGSDTSGDPSDDTPQAGGPSWVATPSTPVTTEPDYSANTETVCGEVQKIFSEDLEDFGTHIGKMIAYREAKDSDAAKKAEQAASKELKDIGAKLKKETDAAQDPDLRDAGAESAAKFVKSSGDDKLFDDITTTDKLDQTIQDRITEWMTPVVGYCA
ncbi:hypothetical protein [Mangrovihabitans endophyticus]|uniref:Secreted protein n=1 Tax=Mangrovihabitans endophyticus TaxID=1751298 RepID=A0A8J3FMA4_9ACTN|nr:hypothetical protein [Mangrovihabitans endophyticus]GGK82214.1 hypothetical protein GCM10012284_15260 [Mangrovihabitans endophyticus]